MPPKRKQIDDTAAETSSQTRATRGSTRGSAVKKTGNEPAASNAKKSARGKAVASLQDGNESDGMDSPSVKKARTTAPKKPATRKRRGAAAADDEAEPIRKSISAPPVPSKISNPNRPVATAPVPPAKPTHTKKAAKNEPYTPQRAQELFTQYTDNDDPKVIGPEGFEKLCSDAGIPLDGALPLVLAWQLEATEMAKFTNEEWTKGTSTLKISSLSTLVLAITDLNELLFKGIPPKPMDKKDQGYDQTALAAYIRDPKAAFLKFYMFSFNLVKPQASKNIDMETSVAFWSVLLVPKYPNMADVIEFINEKGNYKATNKDLWSMMLEFCDTVQPSLADYEADGAWPTLLDDFVAWKRSKVGNGNTMDASEK